MKKAGENRPDSLTPGQSNFIHSEVNAIAKLNYLDNRPRTIFVTHSPCIICAKLIINAKINRVVFSQQYRDPAGVDLLRKRGVEVIQMCEQDWE